MGEVAYTFDDVLILPDFNPGFSRKDGNIFSSKLGFDLPVIAAGMNDVVSFEFIKEILRLKKRGAVIPRYLNSERKVWEEFLSSVLKDDYYPGIFQGVGCYDSTIDGEITYLEFLKRNPYLRRIRLDLAHADSYFALRSIEVYKKELSNVFILAGNVCTPMGARRLIDAGADGIVVGVGPGSACTTRESVGVGCPQLYAIEWVYDQIGYNGLLRDKVIIADGGIKKLSDINKALVGGADGVMMGGLFAKTNEAAGDLVYRCGGVYRVYRGQASREFRKELGLDDKYLTEGVENLVRVEYKLEELLSNIESTIRTCMSYLGVNNLEDMKKGKLIRITENGKEENKTRTL